MSATLTRVGTMSASTALVDGADIGLSRIGGMVAARARVGGSLVQVEKICSASIVVARLEIAPTIVWMVSCEAWNDVYSNRNWHID